MSFYDEASWVLIPEGIKEDVVYAQKPTNGLGDLTFTRASDATRTNSAGVIERTPWNLFQQSEMFSNAVWTKVNSTISIDATLAPNGTLTADTLVENTANSTHIALQNPPGQISGNTYTASIYAKAAGRSWIGLYNNAGGTGDAFFDLSNGTVGTVSTGSAQIQSVGNGWYRCSITFVPTVTGNFNIHLRIASADNVPTYTGNGTSGIFIWGAQLVEGTDAKPYFATTNRQDVPRLHYRNADGTVSTCPRLLLEPQRTNSIRNSTMVGAVAGSPGTLPTNYGEYLSGLTRTVAGIGTENGVPYIDLRFNGTASDTIILINFETTSGISALNGQNWSSSFYVKTIATSQPPLKYSLRSTQRSSGSNVGSFVLEFTPTTTLARYTQTFTTNNATITHIQPYISFDLTIGQTYDFTIRIAAPQMELGAYATTFIPTTTAAVTRLADNFTRSNIFTNGFITSAGGTWFLELDNNTAYTSDTNTGSIFLDSGNFGYVNGFLVRKFTNGRVIIVKYISGTGTNLHTTTTDRFKMAIKWNGTTADIFVNGVKVTTATAFTTTAMQFLSNNGNFFMAFLNQSSLFPVPMTDAQCIQMTT
jgi:hypothetical protein